MTEHDKDLMKVTAAFLATTLIFGLVWRFERVAK